MRKKQIIGISITIILGVGFLVYSKMRSKKPNEMPEIFEPIVTPNPKKSRDVSFKRDKDMTRREYIDKYY